MLILAEIWQYSAYQVQDRHFHHALVKIGSPILDDLDRHHLLGLEILALDDLPESTLTKNVQNQVAVPVALLAKIAHPLRVECDGV